MMKEVDGGRKLIMLQHGIRIYMLVRKSVIRLMKCDKVKGE
jgi:hypothetical protein